MYKRTLKNMLTYKDAGALYEDCNKQHTFSVCTELCAEEENCVDEIMSGNVECSQQNN